jgi:hypothetical protein
VIEELRQAIYTRLVAVLPSTPIRDHVPEDVNAPTMPYVAIGDDEHKNEDTDTSRGAEVFVNVHVFSKYAGSKQAADLSDAIAAGLNNYDLSVANAATVSCTADSGGVALSGDGITREAIVRVRVLLDDITT